MKQILNKTKDRRQPGAACQSRQSPQSDGGLFTFDYQLNRFLLNLFQRLYLTLTAEAPQGDPQRAGDKDGGVAAGNEAHVQGKGEVLGSLAAEPVEGQGGEQAGNDRIE